MRDADAGSTIATIRASECSIRHRAGSLRPIRLHRAITHIARPQRKGPLRRASSRCWPELVPKPDAVLQNYPGKQPGNSTASETILDEFRHWRTVEYDFGAEQQTESVNRRRKQEHRRNPLARERSVSITMISLKAKGDDQTCRDGDRRDGRGQIVPASGQHLSGQLDGSNSSSDHGAADEFGQQPFERRDVRRGGRGGSSAFQKACANASEIPLRPLVDQ